MAPFPIRDADNVAHADFLPDQNRMQTMAKTSNFPGMHLRYATII
jgi:hypothetical protein